MVASVNNTVPVHSTMGDLSRHGRHSTRVRITAEGTQWVACGDLEDQLSAPKAWGSPKSGKF